MNSIPIISTPFSEPWVAWMMLLLVGLVGVANALQPQALFLGFKTLFTAKDRNSLFIDSTLDGRAQVCSIVYSVLMFTMAVYCVLFSLTPEIQFSLLTYGLLLLTVIVIMGVKTFFQWLVGYVFVPRSLLETFYGHYYFLINCTTTLFLPVVTLSLFWSALTPEWIVGINAVVLVFYMLVLLYKLVLMFAHNITGFVYCLVYLLTLEIIPIAGLLAASHFVITNIAL